MNPLWKTVLKWAMPVIIEAGSSFYKKQSQPRQERSAPGIDPQAEEIEALKSAMIRVAEEIELFNRKQAELVRRVIRLRWIALAACLLAIVALGIALSK